MYKEAIVPKIMTLLSHPRLHHALSHWMAEFSPLQFSRCDSKTTMSYLLDHESLSLEYVPSFFLPPPSPLPFHFSSIFLSVGQAQFYNSSVDNICRLFWWRFPSRIQELVLDLGNHQQRDGF